jgi:hypothetical protein
VGPPIWLKNCSSVRHNRRAPASCIVEAAEGMPYQVFACAIAIAIAINAEPSLQRSRAWQIGVGWGAREVIVCCDDAW